MAGASKLKPTKSADLRLFFDGGSATPRRVPAVKAEKSAATISAGSQRKSAIKISALAPRI